MGTVLKAAKKMGVPCRIAHSHNSRPDLPRLVKLIKIWTSRDIESSATHFIACSREAAEWLYPRKHRRAVVWNNAIDLDAFRFSDEVRKTYRAKLGIPEDEFVVTLCDGGYGMARLEKTVKYLLRSKQRMTVIALCGMNEALAKKLEALSTTDNIRLISLGFTDKVLEYICVADLFVGKSGANSMAEPAALGVPIIVTKCITYVERSIKNFYVNTLKGGFYIPSSRLAAKKIVHLSKNRKELEKYRQNLISNPIASYDAEVTADLIWQRVLEVWEK
jgi:UDP-N-acetylglucosamine:LPS N-acetylglucosamine transferase